MKELLLAIKTELQAKITQVDDQDIYIVSDINFIPEGAMSPGITIKDQKIVREELSSKMFEETHHVAICSYIRTDDYSEITQLLDLCEDINTALDQNLLDINTLLSAVCCKEAGTELFFIQSLEQWLIRKIIYFEYEKEVTRS